MLGVLAQAPIAVGALATVVDPGLRCMSKVSIPEVFHVALVDLDPAAHEGLKARHTAVASLFFAATV